MKSNIAPLSGAAALMTAILALGFVSASSAARPLAAAEVRLKNKLVLKGTLTPIKSLVVEEPKKKKEDPDAINIYPILMITTQVKRYFISIRQQEEVNNAVDLTKRDGFKVPQERQKGGSRLIGAVHGYYDKPTPFTSAGQRTLSLQMETGIAEVIQGVELITPEYIKISALNYKWETAMPTTSMPVESLDAILRSVTRQDNPDDRLKIATFYIQAGIYEMAERELEAIGKKFPNLAAKVAAVKVALTQAFAQEMLNEMKLRRAAGQHQFVYDRAKVFPVENVAAPILREVRDLTTDYDKAREKAEQIVAQLGELQGQLKDDPRVKEIAPHRAEIFEKLNYSSLGRLDAYSKLSADPKLGADEKLALALSGWIVGSENAVTGLDQALRLWQARFLVMDYLRSGPAADAERIAILKKLETLEGVGPERIAQMIPLLEPARESAGAAPGKVVRVEVPGAKGDSPAAYWVALPLEYHPAHSYPAIVALHSETGKALQEVNGFWGGDESRIGQSERHGYIVIAPEYVGNGKKKFEYGADTHQIVLDSLRDAQHRFSIDANRVFLAGHSMGADAVWDIGLAHPHLFAGLIPFSGAIDRYAKHYLENGRTLPIFAVAGELDRDLAARNMQTFTKMFQQNFDFVYNEYKGSGPESFYAEIHTLFDWMSLLSRPALAKDVSVRTLRETDNRFYWLEFSDLKKLVPVDWTLEKPVVKPVAISATITPGNVLRVTGAAGHYRLWLAPGAGLVDFNKKLKVDIGGRTRFNDFVKPEMATMLEHLRLTGDHQQIYWAVVDI